MADIFNLSRRKFIAGSAAATGGLVLGFQVPGFDDAGAANSDELGRINGYIQIDGDGTVNVTLTHAEMGQGVYTALPMIVAEELEADWSLIRVHQAVAAVDGPVATAAPGTGGSRSVRGQYRVLSRAGATAREMMRTTAANRWGVSADECIAKMGAIHHYASNSIATYGDLSHGASFLDPPDNVALKEPSEWTLLGRPVNRLDSADKCAGKAVFGVDVQLENMLVGTVMQCPIWGGNLKTIDTAPALEVRGVKKVIVQSNSVIVVGTGYWPAKKGLDAIVALWEPGDGAKNNTAAIKKKVKAAMKARSATVVSKGNIRRALTFVNSKYQAEYSVPMLHHATMEPMNATAWVHDGMIEVWAPTQSAGRDRHIIASEYGVDVKKVVIHVTFLGGGFGRRSSVDFIRPAIVASQQTRRPVKVIWSREEDMAHGLMRPPASARLTAGLNEPGLPVTLDNRLAVPSISKQLAPDRVIDGIDPVSVYGADRLHYGIDHHRLHYAMPDIGVPLGFWRSVPHSYNAFFIESFIDEVARHSKLDPIEMRRHLLHDFPRHLAVMEQAANWSGWADPPPEGHAMGFAMHECFGSVVGQVVELSVSDEKVITLHRITAVVDCGAALNPRTIEAQIEGAIVFGLTAAIYGRLDVKDGAAVQKNFDTYEIVRLHQMPPVNVHILENGPLGGIGEPGLPPLAPALANAIFAANGDRIRDLPIASHGYVLGPASSNGRAPQKHPAQTRTGNPLESRSETQNSGSILSLLP